MNVCGDHCTACRQGGKTREYMYKLLYTTEMKKGMASILCNLSIQRCSRHEPIAVIHPKRRMTMMMMVTMMVDCFDDVVLAVLNLFVVVVLSFPWVVH